jgi:sulfoxide reductase catalytic subunit YedY
MLIKNASDISSSEITPRPAYLNRRAFLLSALTGLATAHFAAKPTAAGATLVIEKRLVTTTDPLTPRDAVTGFNNFYEFGPDKTDPAKYGGRFKPRPWSVVVEGLCGKPGVYPLDDILKPHPLEERIYRMRCVEGWSMVIPWVGFPLGDLLKRFEPDGSAKFVEFLSVRRPEEMRGQEPTFPAVLPWPYREGLRLDEAMHPLTLLTVGVYGEDLPNQNGAPLRLVIPWKYGFKGIKSITTIRFVATQPITTWQRQVPQYYSFYSNVNPNRTNSTYRDQAMERRIGDFFMRKTLMFNGYAEQVASLYAGMNLQTSF